MTQVDFPNTQQYIGEGTCGPVCLLNIYEHFGIQTSKELIVKELRRSTKSSTFPGELGAHALRKKLSVTLLSTCPYTVPMNWTTVAESDVLQKLSQWISLQRQNTDWQKNARYLVRFLRAGGHIRSLDLTTDILDEELTSGRILLVLVESSWVWGQRKIKDRAEFDDIKGRNHGHYLVVYGVQNDEYLVSDPYPTGLPGRNGLYTVIKTTLLNACLIWSGQILSIRKL